ncbi:hypothetical protein BROOK1789C_1681 [Bathymodiolus brooksi thiotrophic gill symbiont]|nr:hypothetical protein BROOK1789B_273 [Bathymodiolus brooksi thiotrophic gill symbiont]CAB9544433.1 hypothetical protein BROOK1789C_1681 [Bathymodiolus brooksi thiotrophic gill symbiont]
MIRAEICSYALEIKQSVFYYLAPPLSYIISVDVQTTSTPSHNTNAYALLTSSGDSSIELLFEVEQGLITATNTLTKG